MGSYTEQQNNNNCDLTTTVSALGNQITLESLVGAHVTTTIGLSYYSGASTYEIIAPGNFSFVFGYNKNSIVYDQVKSTYGNYYEYDYGASEKLIFPPDPTKWFAQFYDRSGAGGEFVSEQVEMDYGKCGLVKIIDGWEFKWVSGIETEDMSTTTLSEICTSPVANQSGSTTMGKISNLSSLV